MIVAWVFSKLDLCLALFCVFHKFRLPYFVYYKILVDHFCMEITTFVYPFTSSPMLIVNMNCMEMFVCTLSDSDTSWMGGGGNPLNSKFTRWTVERWGNCIICMVKDAMKKSQYWFRISNCQSNISITTVSDLCAG